MAWGKGLTFLRQQSDQVGSFGDRLPKLWLKEGDAGRFWFLIKPDDVPVPLCHMEERVSKKTAKTFNIDTLCARTTLDDDPTVCPKCLAGPEKGFKGPYPRPVFPVYVEVISHAYSKEGANWRPMPRAGSGEMRYVETVNAVWLFIPNTKIVKQLVELLEGDPMDPNPEPVDPMARAFRLTVSGSGQQRTDVLLLEALGVLPEAVAQARQNVPDLDKIIESEFGRKPGAKTVASGNPAAQAASANGTKAHAAETVPINAYDSDEAMPAADGQEEIDF